MIIYENSIKGFINDCNWAHQDILVTKIKANMKAKIGRGVSPSEERSWRTTLVKVSQLFKKIKASDKQYILLEFKVPHSYKRIDIILVGSNGKKITLLIIELKGWSKSYPSTISKAVEIDSKYRIVAHPNREAWEYKYLLTEQYGHINQQFDYVDSIALLPNYQLVDNDPLYNDQFRDMLEAVHLYTKQDIDEFKQLLSNFFSNHVSRKYVHFLNKLEYKPSINFQKHLEKEFTKIRLSTSQEMAYYQIIKQIDCHLTHPLNKKLIIISGLPGTGKTIIAFKVLAYIYASHKMTAKLQLPGPEFREAIKRIKRDNDFVNMVGGAYAKGMHQVQIIDEAHKASGQGTGLQFYQTLFQHQNFVIALIDDKQVINKSGFTKSQVKDAAQKQKFDIVEIELQEHFRNGGDSLYIDWLNNWIFNEFNMQESYVNNTYDFQVLPEKTFNHKYQNMYKSYDVRMASFWTQKWNAEFDKNDQPKKLIKIGSANYIWNPNDYWIKSFNALNPSKKVPQWFIKDVVNKNFIQERKGYEYIAYFNTIQGSEFDYIFVHIPKLFYLNAKNELDIDLMQLDFTDMQYQCWMKNRLPNQDKEHLNKLYFKNRLLVNLTRGKKGTFIYCEDKKLEKWIQDKLIRK